MEEPQLKRTKKVQSGIMDFLIRHPTQPTESIDVEKSASSINLHLLSDSAVSEAEDASGENSIKTHPRAYKVWKKIPGVKPPDPHSKGRPRLTRPGEGSV